MEFLRWACNFILGTSVTVCLYDCFAFVKLAELRFYAEVLNKKKMNLKGKQFFEIGIDLNTKTVSLTAWI
jgi:hypothetical protein